MTRKVLFVAYHFPPIQGSSGYLRTLKFVKYLSRFDWEPVVLTAHTRAYEATQEKLLSQIPPGIAVHRAFALNAKKHLSWKGRYPGFLAVPDRMSSWIPAAVFKGLSLLRKDPAIRAVVTTYPISSAHAIGLRLKHMSGLPWVADFRDPMWDEFVDVGDSELKARKNIERRALQECDHALVTTSGMRDLYRERYPNLNMDKVTFLPNGYDEEDFTQLNDDLHPPDSGPVTFLHAGLLDPIDRNPTAFLEAVAQYLSQYPEKRSDVLVRFLAPGNASLVAEPVARLGLGDVVRVEGAVPYGEALQAMAQSHVLLLFQGPSCNHQIPAKLYEYLRIGRPILALAPAEGETGRLVSETQSGLRADIDQVDAIVEQLAHMIASVREGRALPRAERSAAVAFSRQSQAARLSQILADVVGSE